ncbi:MAG: hypothetical protein ABEK01_02555 [Candidatus Nanohaloarchaea archaeon]
MRRKGQFFLVSAVVVSVMMVSIGTMVAQVQSRNYGTDNDDYYIWVAQHQAGKVSPDNPREIENYRRLISSFENYRSRVSYWNRTGQPDCFNVTLSKEIGSDSSFFLRCVDVGP